MILLDLFFPTCQVRVVRFYVRSSPPSPPPPPSPSTSPRVSCLLLASAFSVGCRTSTAIIRAQCSLPDLNRDHPPPVLAAGPQPRSSAPSARQLWGGLGGSTVEILTLDGSHLAWASASSESHPWDLTASGRGGLMDVLIYQFGFFEAAL